MAKKKGKQRKGPNRRKQLQSMESEQLHDLIEPISDDLTITSSGATNDEVQNKKNATVTSSTCSPVGLANLGNTCFFNSIMQNLIQTPLLHTALKHEIKLAQDNHSVVVSPEISSDDDDIPPLTYVPTGLGQVSRALSDFFDSVASLQNSKPLPNGKGPNGQKPRNQRSKIISPKHLFNQICLKNAVFRGYRQQDSQELYQCLLNSIKEEEIRRKKEGILNALNLKRVKARDISDDLRKRVKMYGRHVTEKEDTIIENVFGGKLISSVLCDGCGNVTGVTEPFHDISLPIVEEKRASNSRKKPSAVASEESEDELQDETNLRKLARNDSAEEVKRTTLSKHASKKARKQARRQNRQHFHKNKHNGKLSDEENEDASESFQSYALSVADSVLCSALQTLSLNKDTPNESEDPFPSEITAKMRGGAILTNDLNLPKEEVVAVSCDTEEKLNNSLNSSELSTSPQLQESPTVERCATTDKDTSDEKCSVEEGISLFDTPRRKKTSTSEFSLNLSQSLTPRQHPDPQECSVVSCLYQFTMPELLTGTNKFGCETCTKRSKVDSEGVKKTVYCTASKQMLIKKTPAILTIHLKRFQQAGYSLRKVNKHVSIPVQLDISPFCSVLCKDEADDNMNILYNLYGIVEHSGSLSRGHYTAFIKVRPDNVDDQPSCPDVWFHISDTNVAKTTETKALNCNAYLLFYERIR